MNKACTYLLPLFCRLFYIENTELKDFYIMECIENCYCYKQVKESTRKCFIITLENNEYSKKLLENFKKSIIFVGSYEKEDIIVIEFAIPEEISESYDKYVQGKFSEISNKDKRTILNFNKRHASIRRSVELNEIFHKDENLRLLLEKELDVKIPKGSELSSIPDQLSETLILN